jgi:hypothetical protein
MKGPRRLAPLVLTSLALAGACGLLSARSRLSSKTLPGAT